jgi:polysaccharide deacetylase 2 family uncharacterized protein YibQ
VSAVADPIVVPEAVAAPDPAAAERRPEAGGAASVPRAGPAGEAPAPEPEPPPMTVAAAGPAPAGTAPPVAPPVAAADSVPGTGEPPAPPAPPALPVQPDAQTAADGGVAAEPSSGRTVITERLPRIGLAPAAVAGAPDPLSVPADEPPLPAWAAHARDFLDPANRPPFAIILLDPGQDSALGDIDRAALAAGPIPLTLAIDPAAPRAAEIAAAWRAAGQEVLILGAPLPPGATRADAETAVEALTAVIPEAVGLIDAPVGGIQGDRAAATALLSALGPRGLGIVTWDRGLNAADQIARREAMPAAVVFRDLDAAGENPATIRRYLDRAAFRAAQEGRVVVAGRLRPETVAAITTWAREPRAATVALAPITAIFALP